MNVNVNVSNVWHVELQSLNHSVFVFKSRDEKYSVASSQQKEEISQSLSDIW